MFIPKADRTEFIPKITPAPDEFGPLRGSFADLDADRTEEHHFSTTFDSGFGRPVPAQSPPPPPKDTDQDGRPHRG